MTNFANRRRKRSTPTGVRSRTAKRKNWCHSRAVCVNGTTASSTVTRWITNVPVLVAVAFRHGVWLPKLLCSVSSSSKVPAACHNSHEPMLVNWPRPFRVICPRTRPWLGHWPCPCRRKKTNELVPLGMQPAATEGIRRAVAYRSVAMGPRISAIYRDCDPNASQPACHVRCFGNRQSVEAFQEGISFMIRRIVKHVVFYLALLTISADYINV